MSYNLSKSAQKVQDLLDEFGVKLHVREMSESTRTSQEAADAIGCEVGQIAKSLVFKTKAASKPVLIVASGINQVNEKIVAKHLGEKLEKADAKFVLENTGFAIGGISPIRRDNYFAVYMDEDLMKYEEVWAAAGTPHAVFKLTPDVLRDISGAIIIPVK
ncbi:YbaK/EbsC family protein [Sporomusa malonica]|uniref:Cys-tRNA(Pro) deacylase, prolyl-tRNA editing enzyme YbaK/EbsC n=1 Tax=Sporomusa malonica TaxID=112901 RepID=A0A1W1ZKP1_9FIRM|nr:YbaK/EbsC family protein [Sporomusa malonica]SMC48813.1 Cys-tRNA(Pro) deacylase, prolyl-tRNA editing enzyme YbaK/EbsC [Sporomusa malonica]